MDTITVPADNATLRTIAEIKQVSVKEDGEVSRVNDLLSEGWRLLHIGHRGEWMVYVLGRQGHDARRAGFLA